MTPVEMERRLRITELRLSLAEARIALLTHRAEMAQMEDAWKWRDTFGDELSKRVYEREAALAAEGWEEP